jgi:protein SCO1/2
LGQYFDGKRPVLMAMVYYTCPNLCNLQLNGYVEDLKALDWSIGREFDFVLVSMEPTETPELALKKKQNYLTEYVRPEAAKGWHFLTGTEENVKAFAAQVGFKYKWDDEGKQWAHQAAAYVVTPTGRISRYLYGIQLPVSNFRLAMLEASGGKIGGVMDKIAMFCFKYDPSRRTYAFYAWNVMRAAGALTVLVLGGFLVSFWIRQRRRQVNVSG